VRLIAFRESADLVRRTGKERGYTAPLLVDASGDVTGRVYGVWGPPTVYVVDKKGQLRARGVGGQDWTSPAARGLVEALLAER
jgi:hypothetical protein